MFIIRDSTVLKSLLLIALSEEEKYGKNKIYEYRNR